MRFVNLLRIVLASLLLTGMVFAQGIGASGDIRGTVTDPSGAVVTSANVTATDIAKGIKHTVSTDANGQYRRTSSERSVIGLSELRTSDIRVPSPLLRGDQIRLIL